MRQSVPRHVQKTASLVQCGDKDSVMPIGVPDDRRAIVDGFRARRMKKAAYITWAAGVAAALLLIWYFDHGQVAAAVVACGWGLAWVTLFRVFPLAIDALAWGRLFTDQVRPTFLQLFWIRWIGESVNSLLPVAQVGGDVIRARMAARFGMLRSTAAATVMVDFSIGILTQIVFCLVGIVLLLTVGAFEVDLQIVHDGWVSIVNKDPQSPRLSGESLEFVRSVLWVHLVFAISTPFLWATTLGLALKRFPSPPTPCPHSSLHKKLGWLSAIDLTLTSITGLLFYYFAFVAR